MKALLCLLVSMVACVTTQTDSHAAGHRQVTVDGSTARQSASLRAMDGKPGTSQSQHSVALPPPTLGGTHSLAQLLKQRRSVREFAPTPLDLAQVGQLLWAAQGITADGTLRTAPSAGALYPLELYVVAGDVEGLPAGIYHYDAHGHRLVLVEPGDQRGALASAAAQQTWLAAAPAIVVFGAVHARTAAKYRSRAERYVSIEVGHAAENLFLQAVDLGLATADVGAFDDEKTARLLQLPRDVAPMLLMPVGAWR